MKVQGFWFGRNPTWTSPIWIIQNSITVFKLYFLTLLMFCLDEKKSNNNNNNINTEREVKRESTFCVYISSKQFVQYKNGCPLALIFVRFHLMVFCVFLFYLMKTALFLVGAVTLRLYFMNSIMRLSQWSNGRIMHRKHSLRSVSTLFERHNRQFFFSFKGHIASFASN